MSGKGKLLFVLLCIGLAVEIAVTSSYSSDHTTPQGSSAQQADPQDSTLLEIGQATKLGTVPATTGDFKVVSFNIRFRGGEDLKKLAEFLRDDPEIGNAVVIGLQEVDRNKKRTGNQNTVKLLAEELGMYYAWAAPPAPKPSQEEETGVALLSPYPLTEVKRLVLPGEGPGRRRRAGLGATIKVDNTSLRVY